MSKVAKAANITQIVFLVILSLAVIAVAGFSLLMMQMEKSMQGEGNGGYSDPPDEYITCRTEHYSATVRTSWIPNSIHSETYCADFTPDGDSYILSLKIDEAWETSSAEILTELESSANSSTIEEFMPDPDEESLAGWDEGSVLLGEWPSKDGVVDNEYLQVLKAYYVLSYKNKIVTVEASYPTESSNFANHDGLVFTEEKLARFLSSLNYSS